MTKDVIRGLQPPPATRRTTADFPTDVVFAKNGDMYFTEKSGRLKVLPMGQRKAPTLLTIDVPQLTGYSETGLLGLALAPDFEQSREIYVFHTYEKPGIHTDYQYPNKVIRVDLDDPASRQVILENLPGSNIHNSGKLLFGPDGKLYVAVGDAGRDSLAQDKNAMNGKVLRINSDGSIPDDNPLPGSPVYSYGHRNIFGMAFDEDSRLVVTENGPEANDEVNVIEPGGNYGWPRVTGDSGGEYRDPVVVFEKVNAPTGIIYFQPAGRYLRPYAGKMLLADYIDGNIHVLSRHGDRTSAEIAFSTGKPVTALAQAPNGRLWVAQEDRIYEVGQR